MFIPLRASDRATSCGVVTTITPVTASVTANGGSDAKSVPGRPGGSTYTVPNLKVPCPKEGEAGNMTHIESGSVKYLIGHESDETSGGVLAYYVITFDNSGKRFRYDVLFGEDDNDESRMVHIINHLTSTYWQYGFYFNSETDYGFGWQDMPYSDAPNKGDFEVSATEAGLAAGGYTKLPNRTIAGKSCVVYSHSINIQGATYRTTYALWNTLVLLMEIAMGNDMLIWIAQSVTLEVPDVAFTKTLDITWLE